eukprot:scaffold4226_cov180-Amphora_coffeaeformis.AAC.7
MRSEKDAIDTRWMRCRRKGREKESIYWKEMRKETVVMGNVANNTCNMEFACTPQIHKHIFVFLDKWVGAIIYHLFV